MADFRAGPPAARSRTTDLEPLLRFEEVATLLGISTRSVRRLVDSGALAAVHVSARVRRVRPSDLREFQHKHLSP